MGWFGKSFEEKVNEAVSTVRSKVTGVHSLEAKTAGKVVTLSGEVDTMDAKAAVMREFNGLVDTENTLNTVRGRRTGAATGRRTGCRRTGTGEGGANPRRRQGRHAERDRQDVLRQGEPVSQDLRGQPRHPEGPRQDLPRPEAQDPRVSRCARVDGSGPPGYF